MLKSILCLGMGVFLLTLSACGQKDAKSDSEVVFRVGDVKVTAFEFRETYKVLTSAYPDGVLDSPEAQKKTRQRILNQMVDEAVMIDLAQNKGIRVLERELNNKLVEIPEGGSKALFSPTLKRKGVSFSFWKSRIKLRLLVEKVVSQELLEKMVVTPGDFSAYYKGHFPADFLKTDMENTDGDSRKILSVYLRRKKAERAYGKWMRALRFRADLDIDHEMWRNLVNEG